MKVFKWHSELAERLRLKLGGHITQSTGCRSSKALL